MNNLVMDFSSPLAANSLGAERKYTLTCVNNSTSAWTFYVYQQNPGNAVDSQSLAWLASPYNVAPGARISFIWDTNYYFAWASSGQLSPGSTVVYTAGGMTPGNMASTNRTTFSDQDNTPTLSEAVSGGQPGSLTVQTDGSVPNGEFAVGIGMSGQPFSMMAAWANMNYVFTPHAEYFIAAGAQVQMGQVLDEVTTQSAQVTFPPNIYTMYATLNVQNEWNISQKP